jgi:UDP-N-acetylmuramate dehydrogenase
LNYRKNRHPISFPSAGSTFVNPEIKIKNKKLLKEFPELVEFNLKGTIPAGYLIQNCGIQGKKIGGAQISDKHANFIVNLGGAKSKDVLALMNLARKKVKEKFNINLETEIQLLS